MRQPPRLERALVSGRLSPSQKRRLAYAVALLWLLIVGMGFWYFNGRWTREFLSQSVDFSSRGVKPPPSAVSHPGPTIVHFIDPDCPCSRFATAQVAKLETEHNPHATSIRIYAGTPEAARYDWLPASPAVAIWDDQGQLAYLGPHNDGAFCGEGEDLVGKIMHQLLVQGRNPRWLNWNAVGCFCDWPA